MKQTEFKRRVIRHGEICLIPVDRLPQCEAMEIAKRIVVGHSETGHHHVAVSDAMLELLKPVGADTSDLFLRVSGVAHIEHLKTFDRHETKPLAPGLYRIRAKTQYDYFTRQQTQVVD